MALSNASDFVGNKPSLSDKQVIISPEETPLLSMASEEEISNDVHTYTFDKLRTAKPTALMEGTDTTTYTDQFANRRTMTVYSQEDEVSFGLTNRQMSNDPMALANSFSESEMRARGEQQRNIEVVIGSDQATATQTGTVGALAPGLGWFQSTSNTSVDSLYRATAGQVDSTATASLTSELIEGVLGQLMINGGMAGEYILFAGYALFAAVTKAYLNSSTIGKVQFQHQGNKTIDLRVVSVITNRGTLDIVYAPWLGAASTINGTEFTLGNAQKARGYLVKKGLLSVGYKKGSKSVVKYETNKQGGPRGSIRSIFTLIDYNPLGIGMFAATA